MDLAKWSVEWPLRAFVCGMWFFLLSAFRVPIISTLAQEFALFDNWFCSAPLDTNPNRRFFHAATAYGSMDDADWDKTGIPSTTVFDRLTAHNQTWAVYYFDWSPLCMFEKLRSPEAKGMGHGI